MTANPLATKTISANLVDPDPSIADDVFLRLSLGLAVFAFALMTFCTGGALREVTGMALSYAGSTVIALGLVFCAHFIITRGVFLIGKQRYQGNWYRAYLNSVQWPQMTCGTFALIGTISSFTAFKGLVVGANGYKYDALFTQWDQTIFAGRHGWEITHNLLPSTTAIGWLDFLYHAAFFPIVLGFLICLVVRRRAALRYTYMLSYLISHIIVGMILAAVLSSAGPAFDGTVFGDESTFGPLQEILQGHRDAAAKPLSYGRAQDYLLAIYEGRAVKFGSGISAMPSMHMAFAFLFVFATWHLKRILGICAALYASVIWMTSVHLGWHYFVDGLVSLIVVGALWRMMGWATGLYPLPCRLIRATT